MAPLFSRIDVKGNDHLDFLKPCCMIGYHLFITRNLHPYRRYGSTTPWGPQRQGDALMDPGTLSRKISIFLHLGKHPTEESCGIEIWRKFPTKKKGEISTNLYLVPRKMQKNRWTLHVSLPGLIAVPCFSRIWKIIDLERF